MGTAPKPKVEKGKINLPGGREANTIVIKGKLTIEALKELGKRYPNVPFKDIIDGKAGSGEQNKG